MLTSFGFKTQTEFTRDASRFANSHPVFRRGQGVVAISELISNPIQNEYPNPSVPRTAPLRTGEQACDVSNAYKFWVLKLKPNSPEMLAALQTPLLFLGVGRGW